MVFLREPISRLEHIPIYSPLASADHDDYDATGLDALYEAENKHFWFLSRKERILSVLEKYVPKEKTIFEIGAGTGNVAQYLIQAGYDVSIGEIHINGLRYAKKYGVSKCYQLDLFDPPFANHFDILAMFDVLEHLNDDVLALQQCRRMAKNNGGLILTVPAYNFLWSRDDACGHKRRYTIKKLNQIVQKAGFKVIYSSYFFSAILPLLILRHFIHHDDGKPAQKKDYSRTIKIYPFLNSFLLAICRFENTISRIKLNIPGGSIIMYAKKTLT